MAGPLAAADAAAGPLAVAVAGEGLLVGEVAVPFMRAGDAGGGAVVEEGSAGTAAAVAGALEAASGPAAEEDEVVVESAAGPGPGVLDGAAGASEVSDARAGMAVASEAAAGVVDAESPGAALGGSVELAAGTVPEVSSAPDALAGRRSAGASDGVARDSDDSGLPLMMGNAGGEVSVDGND